MFEMTRKKSNFVVVPTLLTLGNGACGLGSISLATFGWEQLGATNAIFGAGVFAFGDCAHVDPLVLQMAMAVRQQSGGLCFITDGIAEPIVGLEMTHTKNLKVTQTKVAESNANKKF